MRTLPSQSHVEDVANAVPLPEHEPLPCLAASFDGAPPYIDPMRIITSNGHSLEGFTLEDLAALATDFAPKPGRGSHMNLLNDVFLIRASSSAADPQSSQNAERQRTLHAILEFVRPRLRVLSGVVVLPEQILHTFDGDSTGCDSEPARTEQVGENLEHNREESDAAQGCVLSVHSSDTGGEQSRRGVELDGSSSAESGRRISPHDRRNKRGRSRRLSARAQDRSVHRFLDNPEIDDVHEGLFHRDDADDETLSVIHDLKVSIRCSEGTMAEVLGLLQRALDVARGNGSHKHEELKYFRDSLEFVYDAFDGDDDVAIAWARHFCTGVDSCVGLRRQVALFRQALEVAPFVH